MSAPVLLNIKLVEKKESNEGIPSILSLLPNEFNEVTNKFIK